MDPDRSRPSNRSRFVVPVVAGVGLLSLIAVNLSKTHFSLQVRSVIDAVESCPAVRSELGAPVHVERFGTLPLRRYTLRERDADVLSFRARVVGSRATGELDMLVRNEGNQGWAGTYSVRTTQRSVLRDGAYVQEPTHPIAAGRFDPEGRALPAAAAAAAPPEPSSEL